PTPEEKLLESTPKQRKSGTSAPADTDAGVTVKPEGDIQKTGGAAVEVDGSLPAFDWPGFRGTRRDSVVAGVRLDTAWNTSPPVARWRRPIGPGWSSFAVKGDVLYTQEQRADEEIVSAYRLSTGEPVWMHKDSARFYEPNAGAGPRGTPLLHNQRVYALGATGILKALDSATGRVGWTRNAAIDTGVPIP